MTFQINALPKPLFADLFALSEDELNQQSARRITVDSKPGYPCRVSLAEAEVGETVILLNYEHQPNASPYRAAHAIYVREGAEQANLAPGEIPEVFFNRPISVRAFGEDHQMITADLSDYAGLSNLIQHMFQNPEIAYLHLHNAKQGCFAARVTRA